MRELLAAGGEAYGVRRIVAAGYHPADHLTKMG